ncbi:MAG: dihydrodipicolinate synthase family protein [Candidatus Omnitrophica bacterium]|nr:dihydrodipicolinate synthase family protein [Candidatus Omnitrophota bacterium]
MKNKFCGVYAALLTPFDKEGRISRTRLKNLVRFLIKKGIDGLYICGGTGEGPSMDVDERKLVVETVREEAGGKVRLITHVGGILNTKNAIDLARHAEKMKLDAVSSIPPIYYKIGFKEIFDYYKRVAESTSLPFLIYYIPGTTGVILSNEDILRLRGIKNIIGLKYTNPDMYILQDLLLKAEGKWIALSGPDEMFLPALTMGVSGSIGSTQNVLPEIFTGIYKNFIAGDIKKAMELQERVTVAVSLLKKYGGMEAWKTALKFRGIDAGCAREPLRKNMTETEENNLYREWKKNFPEFTGA